MFSQESVRPRLFPRAARRTTTRTSASNTTGVTEQIAVTTKWFGVPFKNFVSGANLWDWDTDTIKISLHTVTYTPDQDTHDFYNDVTNEVSSAGYTAGGATLTCSAPTYDTATNEIRLDATDPSWTGVTFTARYAIVYKSTGTASTSPLIAYIDFGADQTVSAGTFTIVFDATGVVKATAA